MPCQTVLFDFDGVLCKDLFYRETLLPTYSNVYDWIQSNIFGDKALMGKWMKGIIDSFAINNLIADQTEIAYETLSKLYNESVLRMRLEKEVVDVVTLLKRLGKNVGIVTDNMDVFSSMIIPHCQLKTLFDVIINSADYGILKQEDNGKLFDIALNALHTDIEQSLMIDDSASTIELYKNKGGQGFVYRGVPALKKFFRILLCQKNDSR